MRGRSSNVPPLVQLCSRVVHAEMIWRIPHGAVRLFAADLLLLILWA